MPLTVLDAKSGTKDIWSLTELSGKETKAQEVRELPEGQHSQQQRPV